MAAEILKILRLRGWTLDEMRVLATVAAVAVSSTSHCWEQNTTERRNPSASAPWAAVAEILKVRLHPRLE